MSSSTNNTVRITRRAADRLAAGHLWVYRSDVESATDALAPGALVTVEDYRGKPLGSGLYSTASQIAVRMVSREAGLSRAQYISDVRERIAKALERRSKWMGAPIIGRAVSTDAWASTAACEPAAVERTSQIVGSDKNLQPTHADDGAVVKSGAPEQGGTTNAMRLVFSEADDLPGIVIDRYNQLAIVQLLTQGTAQDDVRAAIVESLRAAYKGEALTIWERPDARIRELEQLAAPPAGALFSTEAEPPTATVVTLNGLQFGYDAGTGQKTGAFLDQRLNYAAAAQHVAACSRTGRALDVCTYHGGFALHLARVCEHVTGVDQSRAALEAAERNAALNMGQLRRSIDWVEADAFELLRALDDARRGRGIAAGLPAAWSEPFDAVVLDPPAFAKSRRAAEGALRGYKELNLRAMRRLTKGGTLVTCSCSHHVSLADFTDVVSAAAADAGRRVQLLETRAAAPDHPEVLTLPETRYLKCLICRVE